jgi:2-methylcitrate dehydratase PrpD
VRPSLAARIAAFVEGLDTRALSEEVLHHLRPAALDCLACILGGRSEPVSLTALSQVARRGGEGLATIVGHRTRGSLEDAALVNGTMGHACDYDDVSLTMWGHATAPVLPVALAVAEAGNASGRELLLAFLAGDPRLRAGGARGPRRSPPHAGDDRRRGTRDPGLASLSPECPGRGDGPAPGWGERQARIEHPFGHPKNSAGLSDGARKLRQCVEVSARPFPEAQVAAICEAVRGLERLPDLRSLLDALVAGDGGAGPRSA